MSFQLSDIWAFKCSLTTILKFLFIILKCLFSFIYNIHAAQIFKFCYINKNLWVHSKVKKIQRFSLWNAHSILSDFNIQLKINGYFISRERRYPDEKLYEGENMLTFSIINLRKKLIFVSVIFPSKTHNRWRYLWNDLLQISIKLWFIEEIDFPEKKSLLKSTFFLLFSSVHIPNISNLHSETILLQFYH